MSVTIYEIAKQAGVSSSTVARALRGDVRETQVRSALTAKKIRRIAAELGYRTNVVARAFSRGRTHGIGLLYTDDAWLFEGVNMNVVNSLIRSLHGQGYHLVLCPVDESGSWERVVLGGQIDGGVVFQALPTEVSEAVRARQLPLVLLGDDSDQALPRVVVDDFAGAYSATKHLLGLGHRKVMMFVHESVKPHCSVQARCNGYRAALADAGLEPIEYLRVSEGEAVDAIVRGQTRATGVVCYSDLESTLLVHGLWQYGLAIPADVSIVGFNDVFSTRYMTPPLTTVGFDAFKIGELGTQLVLKAVSAETQPSEPEVVSVKPTLIVRGSTAPPISRITPHANLANWPVDAVSLTAIGN
jgi:DNA-binding LacI/PurR family transcriptional regulator